MFFCGLRLIKKKTMVKTFRGTKEQVEQELSDYIKQPVTIIDNELYIDGTLSDATPEHTTKGEYVVRYCHTITRPTKKDDPLL